MDQKNILITGASGLVGTELSMLYPNAIRITRNDFDLRKENDIKQMFLGHKPKIVVHLAARCGGILDNIKNPALYFDDNILMNTLMLKHAHLNNTQRFIAILSSCIYPDKLKRYPLMEENMHLGPPAPSNFSYAYAKRCMAVQIDAYNKQYGTKYNYVIPCNLYGKNAKVDSNKSHFVTALLVKIKRAVENGDDHIVVYGDGTPLRQYMHCRDLAQILKITIERKIYDNFNIAPEENLSIAEIAQLGLIATENTHLKIKFDKLQPNGQYRKDISIKKMESIIENYEFIKLVDGLHEVYKEL
jgi:GDP-L-fucose synthase|tara:strand:+ start:105 stop:1007 length:903 start_codon:yes stop_codon:yes gene_type:complete